MFAWRGFAVFSTSNSVIPLLTKCRCISEYKVHERSKFMQKLLNKHGGAKAKKKWYQPHVAEPMEVLSLQQPANRKGVTQAQMIRAKQLSHVLYDKITQIMNTGELSEEIRNKQVLVTSVKMQSDFGGVNVYWDSSRTDAVEIESLLQAHARKLRSLLISYHVLGRIPPVLFVKDKAMGNLTHLKQLFEVADYGPDYVPCSQQINAHTDTGSPILTRWGCSSERHSNLQNTHTSNNSSDAVFLVPDSTKIHNEADFPIEKINTDENSNPCCETGQLTPDNETSLKDLNFRSNLYGLPHEDILKKVTAYKTKVHNSETNISAEHHKTNFDIKQLQSHRDKLKQKSMVKSTKTKEQLLQIDVEDFLSETSENDDNADTR